LSVTLIERGESFYQDLMKETVEFLNSKSFLEEDEGRKVMFANGIQVKPGYDCIKTYRCIGYFSLLISAASNQGRSKQFLAQAKAWNRRARPHTEIN